MMKLCVFSKTTPLLSLYIPTKWGHFAREHYEVTIIVTTAHHYYAGSSSSRRCAVLLIADLCFPPQNSFTLSRAGESTTRVLVLPKMIKINILKILYSSTTRALIFQYSSSYVQCSPKPWLSAIWLCKYRHMDWFDIGIKMWYRYWYR